MNKLILTIGLPRSGKSTWARKQEFPIVNLDAIRLAKTGQRWWSPIEHEIHATARTMVRALFLAGHDTVILDATNLRRDIRNKWIASDDVPWERFARLISTEESVCCERAVADKQTCLIPVIKQMSTIVDPIDLNAENIELWSKAPSNSEQFST